MPKQKSNDRIAKSSDTKSRAGAIRKRKPRNKRAVPSAVPRKFEPIHPIINLGRVWDEINKRRPLGFRLTLIRPDDLVVCDFILDNLKLVTDGAPKLVRQNPAAPATLIMELPPQSFGEQAFLDATGPEVSSNPVGKEKYPESAKSIPVNPKNVASGAEWHNSLPFAKIRMAGHSRIAFAMPANETSLDLTADAVLDACRRWEMQLDVNAAPEPKIPLYERFNDRARFNKDWLVALTQSENWRKAMDALNAALGDANLTQSLDDAASRIGKRATQSLNTGKTRGLASGLQRAMLGEINKLAKSFPQLREGATRDLALATLTLNITQVFAASDLKKFDIGAIEYLPFLPIIF